MRLVAIGVLTLIALALPRVSVAQDSGATRAASISELRAALQDTFGLQVESLEVRSDSVVALVLREGSAFWRLGQVQLQDSTRHVAWWLWGEAERFGPVRMLTVCCHPSSASLPIGAIYKARPEAPK
jgi:hypothetical protein